VFAPRLIIVPCGIAERAQNTFKVMLVLKSDVLLDNCDTSRPPVFRNECACQFVSGRVYALWAKPGYKYYSATVVVDYQKRWTKNARKSPRRTMAYTT
jgi:hypothetical protein